MLARHVERKMAVPMPSKRRSLVVQTSMDAYTPPGDDTQTELLTCSHSTPGIILYLIIIYSVGPELDYFF